MLKLALPNKGRLAEPAARLLDRAGFHLDLDHERKLMVTSGRGDLQVLFVRADDIPEFVADRVADAGVTGKDQVAEAGLHVEELLSLGFGKCRLMLAVPEGHDWNGVAGIEGRFRVATSFPHITQRFFKEAGKPVEVIRVSGATEITPHLGVADAIVDLVSTGSTMVVNKLRPVEELLASEAVLIANPESLAEDLQGQRLHELTWVLESVLSAQRSRYLMANVPRAELATVRRILPGISAPTILDLLDNDDLVALHAVVPEAEVFGLVRALKDLGATGILVTPIERLVP